MIACKLNDVFLDRVLSLPLLNGTGRGYESFPKVQTLLELMSQELGLNSIGPILTFFTTNRSSIIHFMLPCLK